MESIFNRLWNFILYNKAGCEKYVGIIVLNGGKKINKGKWEKKIKRWRIGGWAKNKKGAIRNVTKRINGEGAKKKIAWRYHG